MINVSKKILALIMSMLMVFSCMAVSASATGEEGTETTPVSIGIPAPVCTLDKELKTITVTKPANVHYSENGTYYEVAISIAPEEGVVKGFDADGNYLYSQLTLGTEYVITATLVDETNTVTGTASTKVELLKSQEAPAAPVPVAITSKSITVAAAAGCQYILKTVDGEVVYDWTDSTGKDAIMFDNLTENTQYVVAAKKKATDDYYESAESSITIKTKLAGKGKADAPVLEDKTNTSITVAAVKGVEYSIDGGKTWQTSNEFKALKAETQYEIVARYAYDSKVEDPSEVSTALVVKTNAKANYEANKKNISIDVTAGEYAESETKFTAKGNGPANMNDVQYGDTRLVPVKYVVVFGTETVKDTVIWDTVKVSQSGSFTAPDYAEKIVTVKVTFEVQEYKGIKDGKADWVMTESFTESKDVKVGPEDNAGNRAKGILETILNFLLNTVPAFFAQALKSDVWDKLFAALGALGKVMG